MAHAVTDFLSNSNEHIMEAVNAIRRSADARAVFVAIHTGKRAVKSVPELAKSTGLSEKVVLTHGKKFAKLHLIEQIRENGRTAYRKNPSLQAKKAKILSLAASKAKREAYPTKRNASVSVTVNGRGSSRPKAIALTIDDIDSFKSVRKVKPDGFIPRAVSEDQFKRGVQAILGEPGDWRDWGGEMFDLSSTQLVYKGKRIGAVFAFKGPGTRGPLTPKKMGKNGDQIGRMYKGVGRVFILQYGESVEESVRQLMRTHAVEKSDATGETIFHVVIDGTDSHRLYRAYPTEFAKAAKKKTKKKAKKAKR